MPDPLDTLRARLPGWDVDAVLVPRGDEHLGENVPASAERLRHLTGFTGSAGLAVVLADRAAVFSDSRYELQLPAEIDTTRWKALITPKQEPAKWLAAERPGARVGYDPRTITEKFLKTFSDADLVPVPLPENPIDPDWHDRPAPPATPLQPHDLARAGEPAADKIARLAKTLAEAGQDAAVLTDPTAIAWLLNVRARDLAEVPVALAFALLHASGTVTLFIDPARAGNDLPATIAAPATMDAALAALAGKTVRVDSATQPAWFAQTLRAAGATVADAPDPTLLPKAIKNPAEQQGARAAHHRDGVALTRFLHRLSRREPMTEIGASETLHALRAGHPLFVGDSFPAICGAGPNGAIVHYRATPATDRPLAGCFLLDSGGQYPDGTTDVTRTLWLDAAPPPPALRDHYTRVLQGMIAIATLRFPEGTVGAQIDAFARAALWRAGLDFDHGTGHGVGSFLSVHEGPAGISKMSRTVPLAAGMILSDEPGHYRPGEYGIRIENLLLIHAGADGFLEFETLTLAPFDARLIEPALLAPAERAWIDAYHARVRQELTPDLPPEVAEWLADATLPLPGAG